jgi:hypothetical protein
VAVDCPGFCRPAACHAAQEGVPLLDPRTRCFSDLPAWLEAQQAQLRGRRVLMYCTGGVRCERASAYLREMGPAFADVAQLSGGWPHDRACCRDAWLV